MNLWNEIVNKKELRHEYNLILEAQCSMRPVFHCHPSNPVPRTSLRSHQGDQSYPSLHPHGASYAELISEKIHDLIKSDDLSRS